MTRKIMPFLKTIKLSYEGAALWRSVSFCSARKLPAGVVDGVGLGENKLRDGHKGVSLLKESLQNGGQRLRGMDGGIVKEHDRPRLHLGGDPLGDLRSGELLPVQRITFPYRFKLLRRNHYFSLG